MGAQALIAGDVLPAEAYSGMINTISVADVQVSTKFLLHLTTTLDQTDNLKCSFQAAAKRLSSGKLSMAAVGNLSTVPYLDSL